MDKPSPENTVHPWWRQLISRRPVGVAATGFAAVIVLMVVLILMVFDRIGLLHKNLEQVVDEQVYYTQDTYRMLELSRKRSLALHRIVFDADPFERDEQLTRFYAMATEFGAARQRLSNRKLSAVEQQAMARLNQAVPATLLAQQQVIDLVAEARQEAAADALFKLALPAQLQVYEALHALVQAQQAEVQELSVTARRHERQAFWVLLAGGGTAVCLSALMAFFSVRRLQLLVHAIRQHNKALEMTVAERTAEARERGEVLQRMALAANDAVVMIDQSDRVIFWNRAAQALFGYAEQEALGQPLHDLIMPERYRAQFAAGFARFKQTGDGQFIGQTREVHARQRDGSEFVAELSLSSVRLRQGWSAIGLVRDITRRKRAEETLLQLAATDTLTNIANRRKFDEVLAAELQRALRYRLPLTLMLFDIDYFKAINDRHGHLTGDQVLVHLARLVNDNKRANDHLARWGGEEFALLATHGEMAEAAQVAEKLRRLIAQHAFPVVGQVTCSFGLSELQANDQVQSLIARADAALYRAKAQGRNCVCCVPAVPAPQA